MKITKARVIRLLREKHGWSKIKENGFIESLIKDTIDVINDELSRLKNITIK